MAKVPIPDDWNGTDFCCRIIQWPSSPQWTAILLGLLTWPQRGRFWDGRTGTITDAQDIGREIYSLNVLEGGCALTCIDEIIAQLEAIAAGGGGGCGCGSGGAGPTEPAPSTEVVDPPGTTNGAFPDDFASQSAYETYKCNVSTWIIDTLTADVDAIVGANLTAIGLLAFAALLLTPIPGDEIALLLALSISLIDLGTSATDVWQTVYADYADELLCALYSATDANDALTGFTAAFNTAVDTETSNALFRYAIKQANAVMIGFAPVNKIFDYDEFTNFPTGDCSACLCEWEIDSGSGTIRTDGVQFEITPAWTGSAYAAQIGLNTRPVCCEQYHVYFDGFGGTGTPNNGANVYDCSYTRIVNQPTLSVDDWSPAQQIGQVDTTESSWTLLLRIELV